MRRSCGLFGVTRTAYRYLAKPKEDLTIQAYLSQLARDHIRWGFKMTKTSTYDWS